MKAFLAAFRKDPDVQKLPCRERAVLEALCFFAGQQDGDCFPHNQTVADHLGYSARTIQRATTNLEQWGWITIQEQLQTTRKGKTIHVRN